MQEQLVPVTFFDLFPELRNLILTPLSTALISMTCKQAHAERRKPFKNYVCDAAILRYLTLMFSEGDPHLLRWMLDEQLDKDPTGERQAHSTNKGLSFYLPTCAPTFQYSIMGIAKKSGIPWTFARLAQVSTLATYQQVTNWFTALGIDLTGHVIDNCDGYNPPGFSAADMTLLTQVILGDNLPMMEFVLSSRHVFHMTDRILDMLTRRGTKRMRQFVVNNLAARDFATGRMTIWCIVDSYRRLIASVGYTDLFQQLVPVWRDPDIFSHALAYASGAEGSDEEIESVITRNYNHAKYVISGALHHSRIELAARLWRRVLETDKPATVIAFGFMASEIANVTRDDRNLFGGGDYMFTLGGLETFKVAAGYTDYRYMEDRDIERFTDTLYSNALAAGDTPLLDYLHDVEKLSLHSKFLTDVEFIPMKTRQLDWLKMRLPDAAPKVSFLSVFYLRMGRPDIVMWFEANYTLAHDTTGLAENPYLDPELEHWLSGVHYSMFRKNQTSDLKYPPMEAGYYITQ